MSDEQPTPPSDAQPKTDTPEASEKRGGLLYKLALAGVGGVMLAQEEITSFFRAKPPVDPESEEAGALPEASGEQAPEAESVAPSPEARARIDGTVDRVLRSLNVPSRADVDALARQIEALSTRIELLRSRS